MQSTDSDRRAYFRFVEKANTQFCLHRDKVLVRVSPLAGASQRFVPASKRAGFMHLRHCSLLAAHLGECRRYDSMRKKLYLPHMTNDNYATLRDCSFPVKIAYMARNKGSCNFSSLMGFLNMSV